MMDANTLWLYILAAATPIAGVVGFAIQLREVQKTRLENEKLQLEIEALKRAAESGESRIQKVSTDEVLRYGKDDGVRYSIGRGPNPGPDDDYPPPKRASFKDYLLMAGLIALVICFVGYAIYDLYRVLRWAWSLL